MYDDDFEPRKTGPSPVRVSKKESCPVKPMKMGTYELTFLQILPPHASLTLFHTSMRVMIEDWATMVPL
jgi:hypothetical protein